MELDKNEKWETLIYQNTSYNKYEISNIGFIRNKDSGIILKRNKISSKKDRQPYFATSISLGKQHQQKQIIIHRAVAETFIQHPENYRYVGFVDGNHDHVYENNLIWIKSKIDNLTQDNLGLEPIKKTKNNSQAVSKRRQKLKEMAVEYKGGKCCVCGYSKYVGALEFHHKDPDQKDFGISSSGTTRSWDKIKIELDKCICVCANCHREIHGKIISVVG